MMHNHHARLLDTHWTIAAILLGLTIGWLLFTPQARPNPLPDTPKANKKAWALLTAASFAVGAFDVDQTARTKALFSHHHYGLSPEGNWYVRPIVMAPNPVFISSAVGASAVLTWASYKMQHSSHRWLRNTWWVPQSIAIQWNLRGGISQHSARAWYARLP